MTPYNAVVSLRNVSIYNADDPYGRLSIKEVVRRGELVVGDINLDICAGELIYLIGRVGSGKSSLLKTLYAELPLYVGEGEVAGYSLKGLKQRDIPYLRRKMGIVFQDYKLLDDRNVYMNLEYVMKATGWRDNAQIQTRIEQVLDLVDLKVKGYKMPYELSGGEQQRLVIARALLNSPDLILADEPTGNLDPVTTDSIMQLFRRIVENGCAVIMSTHNTALLESYPARALLFGQGKIREINLDAELER
ncbi:MAG: ATP-binding cassette domain-containing protein [Rikenellaceae bacterium]